MACENINVDMLSSAVNNCLSSIDYSISKEILIEINNSSIWNCASRDNFKKSVEKLTGEKFKMLEEKLNTIKKVIPLIEEYQKLKMMNIDNQSKLLEIDNTLEGENLNNLSILEKDISDNEIKMEVVLNTINNEL